MLKKLLTPLNIFVAILLLFAFFLRVYRVNEILGFYYDQGRDGLIIWDLWHKGKFFLIGPTTGIAGIFRGPFYYYLIAPFYLLGGGDPVYPAVFLAMLSVAAIGILYHVAAKYLDKATAIFVTVLSSFSFYIVMASRWLSNPTPMRILSALLIWMMILVTKGKKLAWVGIAFIVGSSIFHFGSATEIFFMPAVLFFSIWQKKNLPGLRIFVFSLIAFLVTVVPLLSFDLRHGGILRGNFSGFVTQDRSFSVPSKIEIAEKIKTYYDVFTKLLFDSRGKVEKNLLIILAVSFVLFFPKLIKKDLVKIICLLFASVTLGMLFFRGNSGVVYDYYFTGYYLAFVFLVAVILGYLWKYKLGKVFVVYFVYLFLTTNIPIIWMRISDNGQNENSISYLNQKKAIDWIYEDAHGRDFNVDVYVPPVIPYAYDYLFLWYHKRGNLATEQVSLLYTLYEVDPPHPERLEAWLARQKGIGEIEESARFGGITIERRRRL